jgi:hypothetical protein
MTLDRSANGVFHAYVRSVFADRSVRSRTLRGRRARWLRSLAKPAATAAEQRWEDEGGAQAWNPR